MSINHRHNACRGTGVLFFGFLSKKKGGCKMNKKGFVNFWFLIIIIFLVFFGGVLDVTKERQILAEDIQKGNLVLTPNARKMIQTGDVFLRAASNEWEFTVLSDKINTYHVDESDLYRAFIAKIWFERARLEMEMKE